MNTELVLVTIDQHALFVGNLEVWSGPNKKFARIEAAIANAYVPIYTIIISKFYQVRLENFNQSFGLVDKRNWALMVCAGRQKYHQYQTSIDVVAPQVGAMNIFRSCRSIAHIAFTSLFFLRAPPNIYGLFLC
ncbi:MAG TPA: hypothetical protein VEP90_19600 [Methylomirabilota bacterium]|nr:hypothetical protein [Methylomirabilota bacterium]